MDVFIYREAQFRKRLNKLYRAGGKECQVASRVDRIIERLCTRNEPGEELGRMTGHGEARVEKCRKLNLGSGYRLLYLKDRNRYSFLFVGAHDECDRWLTHNVGFEAYEEDGFSRVISCSGDNPDLTEKGSLPEDDNEYERELMKRIDERTLRQIYRRMTTSQ